MSYLYCLLLLISQPFCQYANKIAHMTTYSMLVCWALEALRRPECARMLWTHKYPLYRTAEALYRTVVVDRTAAL